MLARKRVGEWRMTYPGTSEDAPVMVRERSVQYQGPDIPNPTLCERPLCAISGRSRMRVYSILALLPVETDGRLRNRIKSNEENCSRIVIEDPLSRLN
jgi:hypothetical protein